MLAKRLRELREENEYTQKDIADKIGLTKSAYGYYERGKSVPDVCLSHDTCRITP